MRRILIGILALGGLIGCLIVAFKLTAGIQVIVVNQAGENLDSLRVEFTGGAVALGTIVPGASARTRIHPQGESSLKLTYQAGGKSYLCEQGYMENGYRGRIAITINSNHTYVVKDEIKSY